MSGISKKLMSAAGAKGEILAIEDVFSTYLYTGNGSTQTITNGIDLAGEGGLVWWKRRDGLSNHLLTDSVRGITKHLTSQTSDAEVTNAGFYTSFNSDGFTIGTGINGTGVVSTTWTFRKAPRFFDVVTYTGNGVNGRTVSHNLGVEPGMIVVKQTSGTEPWMVYHRSLGSLARLNLNNTNQAVTGNDEPWYGVDPTSTEFTVAYNSANASGGTYVAYLFAHDPLGPSGDGSDGLIACGSWLGNGSVEEINLGWEPQFILYKAAGATQDWFIRDNMRGFPVDVSATSAPTLRPNTNGVETSNGGPVITPTGFKANLGVSPGYNYIYIAIRRGPMRPPESGSEVFEPQLTTTPPTTGNTYTSSLFTNDLLLQRHRTNAVNMSVTPRMTNRILMTASTAAEQTTQYNDFGQSQSGVKWIANWSNDAGNYINYFFRRAPEFFDVVAYNNIPSSANLRISHNLGVAPEFIISKARNTTDPWFVWHSGLTSTEHYLFLNQPSAQFGGDGLDRWPSPQADTFGVRTSSLYYSAQNVIFYLFASKAGVSKVGSYTGNGTSQTIDCGFTTGARMVLIKATSTTGDWLIADTARGIVAGNDPYLELNTTNAEVTSEDWLDPDPSGFIVNQVAGSSANASGVSYIYLAIA